MSTTFTKILVDSPNASNAAPTKSEDIKGIFSNTTRRFKNQVEGSTDNVVDFISNISPTGDFKKVTGLEVYITSIRNLLNTPRGSYPFDPEYGSDLHKKVFEPSDEITEEEIRFEVIDKIREFDDRIRIVDVQTEFFSNRKGYRLNITIQRNNRQASTRLTFTEQTGFILEDG